MRKYGNFPGENARLELLLIDELLGLKVESSVEGEVRDHL